MGLFFVCMSTLKHVESSIASIEEVLKYKNDDIVYKFMEMYNISFEESEDIFTETKKWLWIGALVFDHNHKNEQKAPKLFIDDSMIILDEMWHTFVLFTKAYEYFCKKYFGFFIHHSPTTKTSKDKYLERIKNDKKNIIKESYSKTKIQYSFIYDNLGAETLRKWYDMFPEKYSKEKINSLRKDI